MLPAPVHCNLLSKYNSITDSNFNRECHVKATVDFLLPNIPISDVILNDIKHFMEMKAQIMSLKSLYFLTEKSHCILLKGYLNIYNTKAC